jgi:transposase-like protein
MPINRALIDLLNVEYGTEGHWHEFLSVHPLNFGGFWRREAPQAQKLLREYIGAWVDSGFQDDGSERRDSRHYKTFGVQAIFEAMENLLNCGLTMPQTSPQQFVFALQANNQTQYPPRGALSVEFLPRGGVRPVPVVYAGSLSPEELAAWGFLVFWQSSCLFTLMRCASCREFAVPNSKLRESYVRGWHCPLCRNNSSAKAATTASRKHHRDEWFELAVEAFLNYSSRARRPTQDSVAFITERVNKALAFSRKIQRNTITHNLTKIQVEAAGRKVNAKG